MWSYVIEQTNRSLMLMVSLGASLGKHDAGYKKGFFFFPSFFLKSVKNQAEMPKGSSLEYCYHCHRIATAS